MAKSFSLSLGTLTAVFTPLNFDDAPILITAETSWDEEDFLSELSPAKETGRRFMARTGRRSVVIFNNASNGTADIMFIDSPETDVLCKWAQQLNPRARFSLDISFQRDDADANSYRTYKFANAFIQNTPARVLNNDTIGIKFTINYESYESINPATGAAV